MERPTEANKPTERYIFSSILNFLSCTDLCLREFFFLLYVSDFHFGLFKSP